MKVFVIGTRGFPHVQGGVEKHCEELFPRLSSLGLDVTVCTRTPHLIKPYKKEWKGVKFINLWCPRIKSLEALSHTFQAFLVARILSPDILHFQAIGPSLLIPLAKGLGLKVVMTHHGPDYERAKWGRLAKKVLKLGERWGCNYADGIIAISSGIKKQVKEKFNRETCLIPNGVLIPATREERDYVESLGTIPGKYIFAVARFVPEKGLHHLISAFSNLDTGWNLVIAGDADHETEYSRNLKMMAKNTKNVVLTGFITGEPLEELYSHAGLFILPSYYEGLPIVLLEALSYGLSVLVSDISPNREVELDEDRYFPVGNETELTKRLEYWIEQGPLAEKEREEQLEMVRQSYDWDKIAEETLKVYEAVSG
ncbi:MAG: glycosyltransferase family 4 protein [Deltaproteobacteria bacterium]|nr:glycosyltransferase family 4 protein [Deltaproteobacteria bacterium]